jgi:hypothetical protein
VHELLAKRAELREQLEAKILAAPDAHEDHVRICRLLSWNRREIEQEKRRAQRRLAGDVPTNF